MWRAEGAEGSRVEGFSAVVLLCLFVFLQQLRVCYGCERRGRRLPAASSECTAPLSCSRQNHRCQLPPGRGGVHRAPPTSLITYTYQWNSKQAKVQYSWKKQYCSLASLPSFPFTLLIPLPPPSLPPSQTSNVVSSPPLSSQFSPSPSLPPLPPSLPPSHTNNGVCHVSEEALIVSQPVGAMATAAWVRGAGEHKRTSAQHLLQCTVQGRHDLMMDHMICHVTVICHVIM